MAVKTEREVAEKDLRELYTNHSKSIPYMTRDMARTVAILNISRCMLRMEAILERMEARQRGR